jgi:hypothetical protein
MKKKKKTLKQLANESYNRRQQLRKWMGEHYNKSGKLETMRRFPDSNG